MMNVTVQMVVYCVILVLLAIPLGSYMGKVMNGEHVSLLVFFSNDKTLKVISFSRNCVL